MHLEPARADREPIATARAAFSVPVIILQMAVCSGLIPHPMKHHRLGPLGLAALAPSADRVFAPLISASRRSFPSTPRDELSSELSSSISPTRRYTMRPTRFWDKISARLLIHRGLATSSLG